MRPRIVAIVLGVAIAWPIMFFVGFYDPWIGYLAGTGVGIAVCAWRLLRKGRTPAATGRVARGTE